jgi:molecular chaperone GrpE
MNKQEESILSQEEQNLDMEVNQTDMAENTDEEIVQVNEELEVSAEQTDAEKLIMAEAEIVKLKDQLLRQIAEFDNYRKRTLKEKTELILGGGEKVLSALLPVLDDLDRAQQNIANAEDVEALREGVDLIINKLITTLAAQGLKRMETNGQEFNTDFHEAIALLPVTDETLKNHIIDCVQAGYMLNDKVIRHAKVVVGQ